MTTEFSLEPDRDISSEGDDEEEDGGDPICDCIAAKLQYTLPGTPGRKGVIPYKSVYAAQSTARKQGYWIPGVPVNASIVKAERDTTTGMHLFNPFVYTIELEHGPFKWSVERKYRDFSLLNNRLRTHRAAERIRAPAKRTQVGLDDALEKVGIDVIADHAEDCPYGQSIRNSNDPKTSTAGEAMDETNETVNAVAIDAKQRGKVEEEAIQSGILIASSDGPAPENDNVTKRKKLSDGAQKHGLPHFPMTPDAVIGVQRLNDRKEKLEHWLQALLHIPMNRNHHETAEFLEVSRFSFVQGLGGKWHEGFVQTRPGGARVFLGCKEFCFQHCLKWGRMWLILKDTFVCYMDHHTEQIHLVLLFDKDFSVKTAGEEANDTPNGLCILNVQHEVHMKCRTTEQALRWKREIEMATQGSAGSIWLQNQPNASSFPVRENAFAQWFVDARSYMERAAEMMELAVDEILIADWFLSPEIYLKRPMTEGNYWRLDEILKRKATQGVRIFILLYKEIEVATDLNSLYTKRVLQNLHPNIKVMRHPDHLPGVGTFFWAHHEKLLIIDQLIAFVGGVDLSFGRWDDERHQLTDFGSVQFTRRHTGDYSMMRGMRMVAAATTAFSPLGLDSSEEVRPRKEQQQEEEFEKKSKDKSRNAEADEKKGQYHQPSSSEVGPEDNHTDEQEEERSEQKKATLSTKKKKVDFASVVVHVQEHKGIASTLELGLPVELEKPKPSSFHTFWHRKRPTTRLSADQKTENRENEVRSGTPPPDQQSQVGVLGRVMSNWRSHRARRRWKHVIEQEVGAESYELRWLREKKAARDIDESHFEGSGKLWPGKDYVNFVVRDHVELDHPYNDFIDRAVTPRMPWHDIHSVTFGVVSRDVARHFIQRWNATKTEKLEDDDQYPYLLPKSYDTVKVPRIFQKLSEQVNVQVLRSSANWSAGMSYTEDSIQQAYLSLIANSKYYVYIENQFFISLIDSTDVQNEICKVLCDRIVRAHQASETFRVFIMMPLMPAFEGNVGSPGGSRLQAVLHWQYRSLAVGPNSLLENLKKAGVANPSNYLHIGALRTWSCLNGRLVTELIYIHSKLMIVDDQHVIIGSANINDRSQAGNRDSEVCLLFSDGIMETSTMAGRPYRAGRFARSLRQRLMREYLGILDRNKLPTNLTHDVDLDDPVSDAFFIDTWRHWARANTDIYEKAVIFNCITMSLKVFRTYPSNLVSSFDELKVWTTELSMAEYQTSLTLEQLTGLVGFLVDYPTFFLCNSTLTPSILSSKDALVPSSVFT